MAQLTVKRITEQFEAWNLTTEQKEELLHMTPFYRYLCGAKLEKEGWPFSLNRVRECLGLRPISSQQSPEDAHEPAASSESDSPAKAWEPPTDQTEWRGAREESSDEDPASSIADGASELRAALPSGGGNLECTF